MVLYFIVSWITSFRSGGRPFEDRRHLCRRALQFGAFIGTAGMSVLAVRVPLGRLVPGMLVSAGITMLVFGSVAMPVAATLPWPSHRGAVAGRLQRRVAAGRLGLSGACAPRGGLGDGLGRAAR
jgi:hypothetical protein